LPVPVLLCFLVAAGEAGNSRCRFMFNHTASSSVLSGYLQPPKPSKSLSVPLPTKLANEGVLRSAAEGVGGVLCFLRRAGLALGDVRGVGGDDEMIAPFRMARSTSKYTNNARKRRVPSARVVVNRAKRANGRPRQNRNDRPRSLDIPEIMACMAIACSSLLAAELRLSIECKQLRELFPCRETRERVG